MSPTCFHNKINILVCCPRNSSM